MTVQPGQELARLPQKEPAARVCRTGRGKQIKAITFAFVSGARKAQAPLWLIEYPEHVNNSYCNLNPLLLGALVGWLVFNQLPFCNHTCCVPTGTPFLA